MDDAPVSISTSPSTSDRWNDVVAVFGKRGDDPAWCWCQRFMRSSSDVAPAVSNREALEEEIATSATPPGILAYVDGAPAGWSRVMPRSAVPLLLRNRALQRVLDDDPGAWWVTCFAVDRRHRSIGVANALLAAAVVCASEQGATALEGHPVDTEALSAERPDPSSLFTGTMRTFLANGFHEIARTYPSRPVMRRDLI